MMECFQLEIFYWNRFCQYSEILYFEMWTVSNELVPQGLKITNIQCCFLLAPQALRFPQLYEPRDNVMGCE